MKTILAIDDDPNMLAFYHAVLSDLATIRTAVDLGEARKQLDGVDLIVLDFNLEHDNELFQQIVPELKKTAPVLLCSGIQEVGVPVLGAKLGIDGYWNKSADREKLKSLVRTALNSK